MTSAGSPGRSCCSEKIRIDTKNSVGTIWAMRRARKFSMVVPRAAPLSLQFQSDHAHEAVRHLLVAFELVRMRDDDAAMIEIEDRLILYLEPGQLLIDLLALGKISDKAR